MAKVAKQKPIEQLLGVAQSVFVALEEIHLPILEESIGEIRKLSDQGYEALEQVHEHLGLYKKVGK